MYKKYVNAIQLEGFVKLICIPVLIGLVTFLLPSLISPMIGLLKGNPTFEIGSVASIIGMLVTVILMPIVMTKVSKIKLSTLGITKEKAITQILIGSAVGILALSFVACVIFLLGGIKIESNSLMLTTGLIGGLFFFILQGTWEDLIYRSYLMPHFSKKYGDKIAVIATSVIFTLGHALNPNMQILPVMNLFIAGVVFALVYYYSGNLLFVGALHGLWNFSQGYIFGAEVSGNSIPVSLFKSIAIPGKEVISGGDFGFEGGIVTTIVGLILIIVLTTLIKKRNTERGA
ncbi:CPBP family intramembrane glutamic endopeptidase [Staphylococcus delphini]|uniref:CPBP family intramembrane glutamic endopeptidase n=1 Tax=Staphylococcus delphini TaxID=53344 RepID=UPI000BBBA027|nr:type II CAAX endopeptidase family protein [Staphylococcus delphini]PCF83573.1 hypothetical protein B4W69_08415 [Staphylococcus delphini]